MMSADTKRARKRFDAGLKYADRLRVKDRKEMDDDLAWAIKRMHALMEREDDIWKPLLAAAKKAESRLAVISKDGQLREIKRIIRVAIAACGEECD